MRIMVTSFRRSQSVPPTLHQATAAHASTGDCWILTGKSGSVSCGVTAPFSWVLVHTSYVWALWVSLAGVGFDPNVISPLLPSCWGFSFALEHGVSPHSCSSAMQPLLQRLPSCWGFSDLGHGLSLHGLSSEAQSQLLTLDVGYLLHGRSSATQICAVILM